MNGLSNLRFPCKRAIFLTKAHPKYLISAYNTKKESDDFKAHDAWTIWTFSRVAVNAILDPFQQKQIFDLADRNISPSRNNALLLYADLQNPLLKKYNFDIYDFINGVKPALQKILSAAFSVEFRKYCKDEISSSNDNEFLLENIAPVTYMNIALQHRMDQETAGKTSGKRIVGVDVLSTNIFHALTFMHKPGAESDQLYSPFQKSYMHYVEQLLEFMSLFKFSSYNSTDKYIKILGKFYFDSTAVKNWYKKYFPLGSVVVGVTIQFTATFHAESYDIKSSTDAEGKLIDTEVITNTSKITYNGTGAFLGCVSGQTELEWKLVRIDIGEPLK